MSSVPSRIAINWSLGALKENKNLAAIRFPLGWDSKVGPVFVWYEQLSCTKFLSIQHRKDREAPFYHEFLCAKLTDGSLCRFERFGDPGARTDALTEQGSVAYDVAEILPIEHLAVFDSASDLLEEVRFPHEQDLMDVLEICYSIQQDWQTRTYTLQRYNCYFFCWCVLLLLTRKFALWEETLSDTIWDRTIQQLESDLSKAAPTDQDSLVFLLCRWLVPNASHPEEDVIRALCDELSRTRASTLRSLCRRLKLTLWEYDWQERVQGELSNAGAVASWVGCQTPISAIPKILQYGANYQEGPSMQFDPKHKSKFGWMKRVAGVLKNMPIGTAPNNFHDDSSGSLESKLKKLQATGTAEGSIQSNSKAMMHILETSEVEEAEWHILWTRAVGDLLNKYLAPLVILSILEHEYQPLQVTHPVRTRPISMLRT
ncbi:hypothetical protein BDV93DRAFT_363852 [Ceratobasidium sp. AG-I]|nr:hypothetical protein BDV93DRAFT_363852 [Ceratobasidium sp. AG-I]